MQYIILSIPVFFLLISLEVIFSKLRKTNLYRFNDAVTNISCGIGSQVIGVFLKTLLFVVYVVFYNLSPLKGQIPNEWWVWVILFIGVDFCYYWFHRLAHEISIIWGSHVVHHQSEEYNLSVALRQGWIQSLFSTVFYLPLAVIGFPPVLFISINAFQTLYQFWIHTKTIDKLPKPIEYIFNTPSHHRVHHGVNPKYIDRNHGGTLIIFDRMFGTFQAEEEEVVYGITKQAKSWNPLWLNFEYWIEIFSDAAKVSSWKDKWNILTKPPGWKPAELGGVEEPKDVTVETFDKYDTEIPLGLNYYVLFHYMIILIGTTLFLNFIDKEPYNENLFYKFGFAALIIFSLINLGGIFEKKKWVVWLENIRNILIGLSIIYIFSTNAISVPAVLGSVILVSASIAWFLKYYKILSIPIYNHSQTIE